MTLDKALEIKEDMLYKRYLHHPDEIEEADKLGIEALKWIKWRRQFYQYPPILPLPGETTEK